MPTYALSQLTDEVLMRSLDETVARDRSTTALLLAQIGEAEARRLHVARGYSSMHRYCTGHLRMSSDVAYKRIHAARAARRCPLVFGMIEAGQLHMSGLVLLAPFLNRHRTADELLAAAADRSNFEIRQLLAARFPRADIPTRIEPVRTAAVAGTAPAGVEPIGVPAAVPGAGAAAPLLCAGPPIGTPERACELDSNPVEFGRELVGIGSILDAAGAAAGGGEGAAAPAPDIGPVEPASPLATAPPVTRIEPLAPTRYALQVTIGADTHALLREAQALLAHTMPAGDVDRVLHRALSDMVQRLRVRKFGATARPRTDLRRGAANERRIPAAIRRTVARRDGHRCTFVSEAGHRCQETSRLEFDHVRPVARGGMATAANLRLRCCAHNQLEAEQVYGVSFMRGKRESARVPARAHPVSRPAPARPGLVATPAQPPAPLPRPLPEALPGGLSGTLPGRGTDDLSPSGRPRRPRA